MVNEFCGFKQGVIGTAKMPSDTTLNNMKKADLIKLLHTAQHNYESLMWFYNNAVKVNMSQLNNNGWIPCSEKLPEKDMWCLVTFESGNVGTMQYLVTNNWGWNGMRGDNKVIAWMSLPAPYQKGE